MGRSLFGGKDLKFFFTIIIMSAEINFIFRTSIYYSLYIRPFNIIDLNNFQLIISDDSCLYSPYTFVISGFAIICIIDANIFRIFLADTTPLEDILKFKEDFETKYGRIHPTFYQGNYSQVINDAKKELRFLLVYLHSSEHKDTEQFCR